MKNRSSRKPTHEDFLKKIYDLVEDEYTIIEKYIDSKTPIVIKHNICEYEYKVKPANFMFGTRCPKCAGLLKKTTDQFKNKVCELTNNEYTVLGEYVSAKTKIRLIHNCGNEFMMTPDDFLSGSNRCPKCALLKRAKKRRKDINVLKQEMKTLVDEEYEIIGDYFNNNTKSEFKHNICGKSYMTTPGNFLKGNRCPHCSNIYNSTNVKKIKKFLFINNIKYVNEKTFSGCFNKKKLRFDFYLPDMNICIEYNGEQHYKPLNVFGGEKTFEKQRKNDKIKEDFCKNNNIKLIIISYDDNIETILKENVLCFLRVS